MCLCIHASDTTTFQEIARFQSFVESETYITMGMEVQDYELFVEQCLKPFKAWQDTRANGIVSQLVDALSALISEISRINLKEDDNLFEQVTVAVNTYTSQADAIESKLARGEKDNVLKVKAVFNAWLQLQMQQAIYSQTVYRRINVNQHSQNSVQIMFGDVWCWVLCLHCSITKHDNQNKTKQNKTKRLLRIAPRASSKAIVPSPSPFSSPIFPRRSLLATSV